MEQRKRKIPGKKAPEKSVIDRIDDMEKAMEKVAKDQGLPTLHTPSVDHVLRILRKR